jgi:hypothetical protein
VTNEERVSDERIRLVLEAIDDYSGGQPYRSEILACLRELQANRRGEFICSRCYLRKDGEQAHAEF